MSSRLALWKEYRCQTPRMGVSRALPCRFLGTAGQNVSDIFRYSSMEDHLEILEWTLRVRHISPTAPDTLGNEQDSAMWGGTKDQGRPDGFLAWICPRWPCHEEKP